MTAATTSCTASSTWSFPILHGAPTMLSSCFHSSLQGFVCVVAPHEIRRQGAQCGLNHPQHSVPRRDGQPPICAGYSRRSSGVVQKGSGPWQPHLLVQLQGSGHVPWVPGASPGVICGEPHQQQGSSSTSSSDGNGSSQSGVRQDEAWRRNHKRRHSQALWIVWGLQLVAESVPSMLLAAVVPYTCSNCCRALLELLAAT